MRDKLMTYNCTIMITYYSTFSVQQKCNCRMYTTILIEYTFWIIFHVKYGCYLSYKCGPYQAWTDDLLINTIISNVILSHHICENNMDSYEKISFSSDSRMFYGKLDILILPVGQEFYP